VEREQSIFHRLWLRPPLIRAHSRKAPTKDHPERESSVSIYQIQIYAGYQSTSKLTAKQVIGQLSVFLELVSGTGSKFMIYREASQAL
jgi:hypothetical protein